MGTPLTLTIAIDRENGDISVGNTMAEERELLDCRQLLAALGRVEKMLRRREVELGMEADDG